MTTPDTDTFLMGGASASAKFENIGDTITGTITGTEIRQQTSLEDGKPLTWDNGDPRMQLVTTLQTDLRDDDDDDGLRNLYIKGSKQPGSQSIHDVIRAAVQTVGAKGIEAGGILTVSYIGQEPSKTRGFNPRKLYQAVYVPPDHAAATGEYLTGGGGQHIAAAAPLVPAVAPQPIGAPLPGDTPAGKARQLIALSLTDAEVAGATGLDISVVAIIRGAIA